MQRFHVSLLEQLFNVGSGFIISLLFWVYFIVPVFSLELHMGQNLTITGMFTVLSILRGLVFRRLFNYFTFRTLRHE